MTRTRIIPILAALIFFALFSAPARARDLAGIPWKEFKSRSDLIFQGILIKAEMLNPKGGRADPIRYTYRVWKVYKGDPAETVTFDAPMEEAINNAVGRIAIVALRKTKDDKNNDAWALSVDQRSVWPHQNKMAAKDFGGVPVFEIPTTLLYEVPAELSEEVEIKVPYGDDYRNEKKKLFPMTVIDKKLKALLTAE
jgi:hypothetical protein